MKTIIKAIEEADLDVVDGLWAILKYREIGIYRKLKAMCAILNLSADDVIADEAETDKEGRILDKPTRKVIHDALLEASKNLIEE